MNCPSSVSEKPANDQPPDDIAKYYYEALEFTLKRQKTCTESPSKELYLSPTCSSSKEIDQEWIREYKVVKLIGRGSFSKIYQVESPDGQGYALKRFPSRALRMTHEISHYFSIPPHENCVRFYEWWTDESNVFLLMELCDKSLDELLDETCSALSESRIWQILFHLLKHIHEHELVHLDIKPANVLLAIDGTTCKLADFSVCAWIKDDEKEEGDGRYAALESLNEAASKPSDVFSLGLTILEAATNLEMPDRGPAWQKLRNNELPRQYLQSMTLPRFCEHAPCRSV